MKGNMSRMEKKGSSTWDRRRGMPRDRENGGKRTIGPINKSVIGGPRVYPEWLDWLLKVIFKKGKRVWVRKALSRSSSLFSLPRSIGISCRRALLLPVLSHPFLHLTLCFTVSLLFAADSSSPDESVHVKNDDKRRTSN